jgi:Family of unknown function (DUF6719)
MLTRSPKIVSMMNFRLAKLLVVFAVGAGVFYVAPIDAQILKKEPDANQLSCGQKVLVENNTCPAGQILEVTGSCLDTKPAIGMVPRGLQFNCIKRN